METADRDLSRASRSGFRSFFSRARQAGLWRRGTMTVIRSVFVPGDGWLLRTPGRPSLHPRESKAESDLERGPTSSSSRFLRDSSRHSSASVGELSLSLSLSLSSCRRQAYRT